MGNEGQYTHELLLGCIADDVTGASDMGLSLSANGMPTPLFLGVPAAQRAVSTPAVIIALKIRTIAATDAVQQAGEAANWLLAHGARQLYYKYCSTFDSSPAGNIGPVTDKLLQLVDDDMTVLLPAFPANGRTVRSGNLYVNDVLLSDTSMRNHPLTPMTESYLPALMQAQTETDNTGLVTCDTVDQGSRALRHALDERRSDGKRFVVVDTRSDSDLEVIADATTDLKLMPGASGVGEAIPGALRRRGLLAPHDAAEPMPQMPGHAAVLAGSCSEATRAQVAVFQRSSNSIVINPQQLHAGQTTPRQIADAAVRASQYGDVLVYSSASPEKLRVVQHQLGIAESATLVEDTLAYVARQLCDSGIRKFIIAGGETSGAVSQALGVSEFAIGPQIAPGVPWLVSHSNPTLCIALKSGNFGAPDFFQHALAMLP